jgi:hypothetical protein
MLGTLSVIVITICSLSMTPAEKSKKKIHSDSELTKSNALNVIYG